MNSDINQLCQSVDWLVHHIDLEQVYDGLL